MKKGGEPQHIHIRMRFDKFSQTLHGIYMSLWLPHIKRNLVLHILPVIDHRIVHMYRIPHNICKKAYGIIMKRDASDNDLSCFLLIGPVRDRNHLSSTPVNHLPPAGNIIPAVRREHIGIKSFHQTDAKRFPRRRIDRSHQIHLLNFIGILPRPLVILSRRIIGRIYL